MRILPCLLLVLNVAAFAADAPATPKPEALQAEHTFSFAYTGSTLTGPGADWLIAHAARSQFVLLGEVHMDHEVPIFAGALFTMLHQTHGYRHLVVEQDPVAMESVLAPELRGNAEKIAALAKRYPSLFEFDSDEDLTLLADVGRLVNNADAIWGVEQTTGTVRYLEELLAAAPNESARELTESLLAAARAADPGPKYSVNWLATVANAAEIAKLTAVYAAQPGSREARLLGGLAKSAEIFGYYTRANAGEFVGLFNNTVREEVLKANFLRRYHAAAKSGVLPKALFKFGSNHLYRGKNPTQAFPIGNLAHELAIVNGSEALGLDVIALGENYVTYQDIPTWMRPLLPATEPTGPTLIDLRGLRPYQRLFREGLSPAEVAEFRTLINGYDAIVLLPQSKPSSKLLAGRGEAK